MQRKLIYMLSLVLAIVIASLLVYNHFKTPELAAPIDGNRYNRGHNIPGKLYWAGSEQDKMVALTFDDGPEEHWTPKILDILKEKKVKATFFVIGEEALKHPTMLKRIYSEGHVIGNHTFDHINLKKADSQQINQQLEECDSVIYNIIGETPKFVRPPFGFHNQVVDDVVYAKNKIIILWSIDTKDWTGKDTSTVEASVVSKMQNGYIVLQHDGASPKLAGSVEALPDIIDRLKDKGYTFVTVAELLNTQPYQ
ncbi:MAG: polysaccharide deacetylase [Firmicutes bacterium]|nr:polysaccharide deacetylase [Bacillota bacterium]